jgi:hypothetical protein
VPSRLGRAQAAQKIAQGTEQEEEVKIGALGGQQVHSRLKRDTQCAQHAMKVQNSQQHLQGALCNSTMRDRRREQHMPRQEDPVYGSMHAGIHCGLKLLPAKYLALQQDFE